MVEIVKVFDFSNWKQNKVNKQNIKKRILRIFTVKLSRSLFVGKLGLTLRTCDGKTSGTGPDKAAID